MIDRQTHRWLMTSWHSIHTIFPFKSSRLKLSDKILAQNNFTLLTKDKSLTFARPLRWVQVTCCMWSNGSPSPRPNRREPRAALRAGQWHFSSHLDSWPVLKRWVSAKGSGTWPLILIFSPVPSAARWTFPSGHSVCLSTCFSILVLAVSSGDLTSYPFIQTRITGMVSSFLSFPSPHRRTSPSTVSSHHLSHPSMPFFMAPVQENTTCHVPE